MNKDILLNFDELLDLELNFILKKLFGICPIDLLYIILKNGSFRI